MRLIDADALENEFGIEDYDILAKETIREAPVIDPVHAAGGCYCRECKLRKEWNAAKDEYYCGRGGILGFFGLNDGGFCSSGERKGYIDG